MINFGQLTNLWLILPMLLGVILLASLVRLRFKLVSILAGNSFPDLAKYKFRTKLKLVLWLIAFGAIFVACLAPQWGEPYQLSSQTGRNIVIALDVSKSMLAQDLKPNRLEFAKNKIKKLITLLAGEQVGLLLFAGDAIVVCPLTRDQDLLELFLDEIDLHTVSSGTTNLAKAITTATKMFVQGGQQQTNLLAIFTDGEDFSQDLTQAGGMAQQAGVQIFTFGVATQQGAPIPELDLSGKLAGFIKNDQGEVVVSRLNQALLQDIAIKAGGQSVVVQAEQDSDLQQMLNWVTQFERHNLADQNLKLRPEKYYYFAALALFCLLIEWIL